MPTHAPKKYLISHTSLQQCFDKSRSGLEKLRETDPSFPRPIKFGPSKQAGVYFVVAEVEAWLESKISERDGVTQDLSERNER
jgi:prophage regulatory protein